ncbi:MAG: TraR/DksA C4-type zinc finger protein [candidate division KSB1 bacterium]|nr:TraR/DksA C4-type zinc finger protein [candidate division KSB1 bacterium]MDQ7064676.1 TraR/DksA C4-type zinc finger protein [candidate division KSB1 bacterium]
MRKEANQMAQSSHMTKEKLEYFKQLILEKRAELLQELGYLEDGMSVTPKEASGENTSYTYHMADLGTDYMEREKAFFFARREGRLLYHLDQALERIEKGTYGICRECGQPISEARLEAVPHASMCIECKSNEEKKRQ